MAPPGSLVPLAPPWSDITHLLLQTYFVPPSLWIHPTTPTLQLRLGPQSHWLRLSPLAP